MVRVTTRNPRLEDAMASGPLFGTLVERAIDQPLPPGRIARRRRRVSAQQRRDRKAGWLSRLLGARDRGRA